VAAGAAPAANGASSDVAARLQQLDQLQATGAISDAEYAQKRAEILSQI
jgi:hypothetical protein